MSKRGYDRLATGKGRKGRKGRKGIKAASNSTPVWQ